ncbi:MAG TPA: carboxypeptidase-like regulatory domain-containing protein [Bryobacteraceae bacterium]|nr:carboxypeptidase-like regulatory domain-containing protein [Bryobacteraceae bacterium]
MMKKRTRKKTKIGSKIVSPAVLLFLAISPFYGNLLPPGGLSRGTADRPLLFKKDKTQKSTPVFSLIAGTVFRPPGFALPGAEIVITPESGTADGIKIPKQKAISDARGEFAVRVPPVPMKYTVDVKASGYVRSRKAVQIDGEQRKELSFELEPDRE